MFSEIKRTTTSSLLEIKKYLDEVSKLLPALPEEPSDFHNSLKGLFFVYLYGVYESAVTKTVRATIEALNDSHALLSECIVELYTMILNDEYDAIEGAGRKTKWKSRWKVPEKFRDNHHIKVNTEVLPTDGQNYRYAQLESIVKSFGVPHDVLPQADIGGYIAEMVTFRNHIAHGDELPSDVGKKFTIPELSSRLQKIDAFCTYFIDMFENYISSSEYRKSS